jgi:hypothetical protein
MLLALGLYTHAGEANKLARRKMMGKLFTESVQ